MFRVYLFLVLIAQFVLSASVFAEPSAEIWDSAVALPKSADLVPIAGLRIVSIKPHEVDIDGFDWIHGVALAWHKGALYASFGLNTGKENTATEIAGSRVSYDEGLTWEPLVKIDDSDDDLAISHGVFCSKLGTLWAFQGAFHGDMQKVHTRAYRLNEADGTWSPEGIIIQDGFWPMQEPQQMTNGNWIIAGIQVANGFGGTDDPVAVAISNDDDFTRWQVHVIPKPAEMDMWGESTVILDGANILNIARYRIPVALASRSSDFGRTWSEVKVTNLPMTASKPYAGTLSTGQRYLICTTTADSGRARNPLTLAVSRPGEDKFSKIYLIRAAEYTVPNGENLDSHPNGALSYPYAVEHDGRLYVGYSNSGGRPGNRNSLELAIIPLESIEAM